MTKRFSYFVRRIVPMVSAGFLFQTSGCTIDTNSLFASLATSIANQLISSFVFGAFNLTSV